MKKGVPSSVEDGRGGGEEKEEVVYGERRVELDGEGMEGRSLKGGGRKGRVWRRQGSKKKGEEERR